MAKFLVTGANGTLGRLVVQRLAERREEVRGLVRPNKLAALEVGLRREIELVAGDYGNEKALVQALAGVDYVITAVRASLYDRPAQHYAVEVDGNRRLFRLAAAAGVQHLTFISLMHAEQFPQNHIFNAKHQAENILNESGLNFTVFRPGALMSKAMLLRTVNGLSKGWFVPVQGENMMPFSPMMYDDLAELVVRAAVVPEARNALFEVGGPQVFRGSEWVRDLAATYGLTLKSRSQPSFFTDMMQRLVQPESRNAKEYMYIKTKFDFSVNPGEMERLARLFEVRLHTLAEFYPPLPPSGRG